MKRLLSILKFALMGATQKLDTSQSDVDRMIAISKQVPTDLDAVKAVGEGIFGPEWRVSLGCCRALGNAEAALPQAVDYLVAGLAHKHDSVRRDAASALKKLGRRTPLPGELLWQHLQKESYCLAAFELAAALAVSSPGDLTEQTTSQILDLLKTWFTSGGSIPIVPADCQVPREEVFTPRPDGYLEDTYGIACGLMDTLIRAPGLEEERFNFFLKYLQAEYGSQSYTGCRVKGLLALCTTDKRRTAILEAASSGRRSAQGHPNLSLLREKPEWAADILERHLTAELPVDVTNWKHFLGKMAPEHMEPLSSLFQRLTTEHQLSLINLLPAVPLEAILGGIESCLNSEEEKLVVWALNRLQDYQQPVPTLLPSLFRLRESSANPTIRDLCGDIIGQSGGVSDDKTQSAPQGRYPTLQLEIQLDQFGPEQKPWNEILMPCRVHYTGEQILIRTPTGLSCFKLQDNQANSPRRVDLSEDSDLSVALVGENGDVFLTDSASNYVKYHLLRDSELIALQPRIPFDHRPSQQDLKFNGKEYGWSIRAWIMSHFEHDPGHHEDVAYTIVPSKGAIRTGLSKGYWREISCPHLSVGFTRSVLSSEPLLKFRYVPEGGFRVLKSHGLVLAADKDNPIDSAASSDGKVTVLVDAFAEGRLRVSLWSFPN